MPSFNSILLAATALFLIPNILAAPTDVRTLTGGIWVSAGYPAGCVGVDGAFIDGNNVCADLFTGILGIYSSLFVS